MNTLIAGLSVILLLVACGGGGGRTHDTIPDSQNATYLIPGNGATEVSNEYGRIFFSTDGYSVVYQTSKPNQSTFFHVLVELKDSEGAPIPSSLTEWVGTRTLDDPSVLGYPFGVLPGQSAFIVKWYIGAGEPGN